MCGFVGFLGGVCQDENFLTVMADQILSRGPDGFGVWVDRQDVIGLAHRRLAIMDLSSAGHQPMISSGGRFVISFNGEIYNHLALRIELNSLLGQDSVKWNGNSDTETLLACIECWGIERALQKSIGMFAFALWDKSPKK